MLQYTITLLTHYWSTGVVCCEAMPCHAHMHQSAETEDRMSDVTK